MTVSTKWKVVGGIAAVVLPAAFNFAAARLDSDEAKVRAEVAYETMVGQVAGLQKTAHALELKVAGLEGQVVQLSRPIRLSGPMSVAPPPAPTVVVPLPAPNAMKPPPDFEEAVRDYKAKK